MLSCLIQCEASPTPMSRRDLCWRGGSRGGRPADMSHGTGRVIEVKVITTAGSDDPRAGSETVGSNRWNQ
jgi:hypothetical protein